MDRQFQMAYQIITTVPSINRNKNEIKIEGSSKIKETKMKEVKTEEKAVVVDGSEIVSEEVKLDGTELESAKIEPEKVEDQKLTSTTSLLDRLILEAKKNVKETTTIPTETNKANVSDLNNSENIIAIKYDSEIISEEEVKNLLK